MRLTWWLFNAIFNSKEWPTDELTNGLTDWLTDIIAIAVTDWLTDTARDVFAVGPVIAHHQLTTTIQASRFSHSWSARGERGMWGGTYASCMRTDPHWMQFARCLAWCVDSCKYFPGCVCVCVCMHKKEVRTTVYILLFHFTRVYKETRIEKRTVHSITAGHSELYTHRCTTGGMKHGW